MNSVVIIPPASLFERSFSADALPGFLEIAKLSCLFFDKVYIDKDVIEQLESSAVSAQHPEITDDLLTLQSTGKTPAIKKTGVCEVRLYPTKSDALHLFSATKQFPYTDTRIEQARRAKVKFGARGEIGEALEWDILGQLDEEQKRHHLAVFHLVGTVLEAHTHTLIDGTPESTALESQVVSQLASVLLPDLSAIPLSDILAQRKRRCFRSVRDVVSRIAERARLRQPLLSIEDSVTQETLREMFMESASKIMTKKQYAVKVGTGLAGYMPILSAFTNTFDLGINTKEFIQGREHWLSFFTSFKNAKDF